MSPDLSTVSDHWIRRALRNESLFSDSSPRWAGLPSHKQACRERQARVRLFRKYGAHDLALILTRCNRNARCASGSCPACNRALQRHLVAQAFPVLQPHAEFVIASLIPDVSASLGQLAQLPIAEFTGLIESHLSNSRIHFCVGGIDFSYNEHRRNRFAAHWAPHVWLLIHKYNRPRWEALLRRHFRRTKTIPRPVMIKSWDGDLAAIGYSLKYKFGRRISGIDVRSAGTRRCNVTDYDRLRSKERFELYSYLHEIGLGKRILVMGLETTPVPTLRFD